MPQDILLGRNIDTQKKVYIPENIRSTHMQVIGSTGTGKSKFLEWMIRNDILNGNGLCLIDPHGYLYDDLINWLTSYPEFFKHKKIVLFNPASDDYFLGFNPFIHHSLDISHQVDTMVNSCAKAWGAESMDSTPLLKKCLRCIFHALAEADLTLLESLFFISLSYESKMLRKHLIEKIKNPIIKEVWESFMALRSRDNARLLGTLMINDLFLSATERKRKRTEPPKPFYLYIDECAQFLNEDIGRILDECRKFGLHLILAHQHLAQLRKAGEDIYSSIMTDAKTKVIFGGLTPDDAEILAKQIFMGEFDIDEVKHEIHSRKVIDYRLRWFRSEAESEGHSDTVMDSWSEGTGKSSGSGSGMGESMSKNSPLFSEEGVLSYSTSEFVGSIQSSSMGGGSANTVSHSVSKGLSEGLEPIMGTELSSVQFRPLEEQLYRAMALMVNQPQAHCLVKMPLKTVKAVKVPRVAEAAAIFHPDKDLLAEYQQANFEKYKKKFIALREQVDREIDSRQIGLLRKAKEETEIRLAKKKERPRDFRD